MQRRQVLCVLVVLAALTAGCMNAPRPVPEPQSGIPDDDGSAEPTTPTEPGFPVPEWTTAPADDGNRTLVEMRVRNGADWRRGVNVTVSRTIGDEIVSGSTELTLDGNETQTVQVHLDVPYERFEEGSALDFVLDPRPAGV
jgi:hypothetical protein